VQISVYYKRNNYEMLTLILYDLAVTYVFDQDLMYDRLCKFCYDDEYSGYDISSHKWPKQFWPIKNTNFLGRPVYLSVIVYSNTFSETVIANIRLVVMLSCRSTQWR